MEEQAKGPVLNPFEMGMPDTAGVVRVLKTVPGYRPLFEAAFPGEADAITYDHVAMAIGAFERRLVTPSRFDESRVTALDQGVARMAQHQLGRDLTDAQVKSIATFLRSLAGLLRID